MSDPFGVDESSSGRRRLRRRKASRSSRWIQRRLDALQVRDPQNLPPQRTLQQEPVQRAAEIPAPEPAEVHAEGSAEVHAE
ncbi:MAG: hypothetical protein ACK5IA_10945, partial [Cyanobacteriota bacterium]